MLPLIDEDFHLTVIHDLAATDTETNIHPERTQLRFSTPVTQLLLNLTRNNRINVDAPVFVQEEGAIRQLNLETPVSDS